MDWWRSKLLFLTRPGNASINVEPKIFFSVERTFYKWMHFSIAAMSLGSALIGLQYNLYDAGKHPYEPGFRWSPLRHAGATGVSLLCAALAAILYALFMFHWRILSLEKRRDSMAYADRFGPTVAVLLVLVVIAVNMHLHLVQMNPPCTDYGSFLTQDFEVGDVMQHPQLSDRLLIIGTGLAELNIDTQRVRRWPVAGTGLTAHARSRAALYILSHNLSSLLQFDLARDTVTASWALQVPRPPDVHDWKLSAVTQGAAAPDDSPTTLRFLIGTTNEGVIHEVVVDGSTSSGTATLASTFRPSPAMVNVHGLHLHPSGLLYAILDTSIAAIHLTSRRVQQDWPLLIREFRGLHVDDDEEGVYLASPAAPVVAHMPFSRDDGAQFCENLFPIHIEAESPDAVPL